MHAVSPDPDRDPDPSTGLRTPPTVHPGGDPWTVGVGDGAGSAEPGTGVGVPDTDARQEGLFEVPAGARRARARVIILTGPSGSGKTSLTSRTGTTSLSLDHFYRNGDDADMPMLREGLVDWDDPRSWNADDAVRAILELCRQGQTEVPIYDIPTNRRTGVRHMVLDRDEPLFVAEGIFAAELVHRLEDEGVLADAICIARSPVRNMWFRLLRDMGEARKPVPVLIMRGLRLAREEPGKVRHLEECGCRPVASLDEAAAALEALVHAERRAQRAAR
ncbi:uridine kinase family protein [Actinomyces provencensis]|uniref:uridine kinase family protein n=1 Tax=Actinomyces provencensis TaxID=1720198 RepID=UPI001E535991|nr:ATP-binding protein [Actinomyces provencensis]